MARSSHDAEPCGVDVGFMELILILGASIGGEDARQSGHNLDIDLFVWPSIMANGAGSVGPFFAPTLLAEGFVVALDADPGLDLPFTLATGLAWSGWQWRGRHCLGPVIKGHKGMAQTLLLERGELRAQSTSPGSRDLKMGSKQMLAWQRFRYIATRSWLIY